MEGQRLGDNSDILRVLSSGCAETQVCPSDEVLNSWIWAFGCSVGRIKSFVVLGASACYKSIDLDLVRW
jgi:hypothetical protein